MEKPCINKVILSYLILQQQKNPREIDKSNDCERGSRAES